MRIMITGASGYFGQLVAQKLRDDLGADTEIIGVDVREREDASLDMRFLAGDTRKKRIEDIFKVQNQIDVVIHLARDATPGLSSDKSMMTNVYGTAHMLELALKYKVKQFIFPSASIVYGAHMDNPALIHECSPLLGNRDVANIRDRVEADMICQSFSQNGKMKVVILRIVPIWRAQGNGMLQRYMKHAVVPTLLGYDPMFQIIYEEEVLEGQFRWSENVRFDFNYLKYPFCVDGDRARRELKYIPEEITVTRT